MKIVSYYTKTYSAYADRLRESARKFGLRCDLERVPDQGSWKLNTSRKPVFLRRKLEELKYETAIVWIDADAVIHQRPTLFVDLLRRGIELAVYRHVEGVSYHSSDWHNFGQLWNGTIFLRVSSFTKKVVDEWVLEQERFPERLEQKNLASVLTRVDPHKLYCLPPEYCWIEKYARPLAPNAMPVIEHFMAHQKRSRKQAQKQERYSGPEVLWCGHLYDHSGYAKANREVLFRVANSLRVGITQEGISEEPVLVDDYTRRRLDVHATTVVSEKAPLIRFYTPMEESVFSDRYRICWTMLETHPKVHPDFIRLLNENYHEVWTPTEWNKAVFIASGLKITCLVMPLGFSHIIYSPGSASRPKAKLLTTKRAGSIETPKGHGYITVCQPTFRKGLDVLIRAWEEAGRKDDSLIIYTGVHEKLDSWGSAPWRWVDPKRAKTLIYHMTGRRTEQEMAQLYRSMDCYVTATRGEGFDLPLLEAIGCGLPVIAPYHTSHLDFPGKEVCLIRPDGFKPVPYAKKVSRWYEGMSFAHYGKAAIGQFVEAFRAPLRDPHPLRMIAEREYTWDRVASLVVRRLLYLSETR